MKAAQKLWKDEEVETIIRLAKEGKTRMEIAEALPHRSVGSTLGKIRQLYFECKIDYIPKEKSGGYYAPKH